MLTDLVEIRRLEEAKREENVEFRRYLKAHHTPEEPFHILAAEVEQQIDCTQCANCCRELSVTVTTAEVQSIAEYLGISAAEVLRLYTSKDENEIVLKNDGACVFLDGNLCIIYEARPRPCREFPHSDLHRHTLGGRMASQCRRAAVCPIVYNTLEAYKHLLGWHAVSK